MSVGALSASLSSVRPGATCTGHSSQESGPQEAWVILPGDTPKIHA